MHQVKKYINSGLIAASYGLSRLARKPLVWGMPFAAGIELTNNCNLRCPHCTSGSGAMTRQRGYISSELFESVISQLEPWLFRLMFYFQGESMMHPDFFDMLGRAKECGTVVSTNGHFLTRESCRSMVEADPLRIIVSFDGISRESYSAYRVGGDYDRVREGIVTLAEELKKVGRSKTLVLQALVNSGNESELGEIRAFGEKTGARVSFKSMQLLNAKDGHGILPGSDKYRRYRISGGRLVMKGRQKNYCRRLWIHPVITWDGRVVPCCFDKDATYIMGDLNRESFKSVWTGDSYMRFRKMVMSNRAGIEICSNCTEGLSPELNI